MTTISVTAMSPADDGGPDITQILSAMSDGVQGATSAAWSALYEDLRRQAGYLERSSGLSLQATEIVSLAFERVQKLGEKRWGNQHQFLAFVALSMHSAIVDHARQKKRRVLAQALPLDEPQAEAESRVGDLLIFEDALEQVTAANAKPKLTQAANRKLTHPGRNSLPSKCPGVQGGRLPEDDVLLLPLRKKNGEGVGHGLRLATRPRADRSL